MVTGFPPNTNSWSNNAFPDPSFSVYGTGVWSGNQRLDETHLGPLFDAPGGSTAGSEVDLFTGMQFAAPLEEQVRPVAQRALHTSQSYPPPSMARTQAPGSPWQSTFPWYHPVHPARQHNGHSSSIHSLGMRPENSSFQSATSLAMTRHFERSFSQTSCPHPIDTGNSVQFQTRSDPVPVSRTSPLTIVHAPPFFFPAQELIHYTASTPRSRGERWDPPNATTFQCLWSSRGTQCSALIAGDRRRVTSHLRDEHDFTCDGQMIACAWAGCTTWMQRRNIPRHIIACHFAIKVTCPGCGLALSRADANKKHRLVCMGVRTPAVMEATEEDEGGYF